MEREWPQNWVEYSSNQLENWVGAKSTDTCSKAVDAIAIEQLVVIIVGDAELEETVPAAKLLLVE